MARGTPGVGAALALVAAVGAGGCSVRQMAVNTLGNALASGTSAWAEDEDLELVRDATPFALKTIESLLGENPRHRGLLRAAAAGFTQYAYAFVHSEADYVEEQDLARATALRRRAVRLYLRARTYGLRALEEAHPGLAARLLADPAAALAATRRDDTAALYWTAAAWGAAISLAKDDAELAADLKAVEALARRALALDEGFGEGAIHDFFIAFEGGRPAAAGGSTERARAHFQRAVAISRGQRAAPYVALAESVCLAEQNRAEFEALLRQALAVDLNAAPAQRLANQVAQRRARWLLARSPELFLEE